MPGLYSGEYQSADDIADFVRRIDAAITSLRSSPPAPSELVEAREAINWDDGGKGEDDFCARLSGGYLLRVEKMDMGAWWWQVYCPDGSMANPLCDMDVATEYIAKQLCERFYRLHRAKSSQASPWISAIRLEGTQGEPAGCMKVIATMSDGSERELIRDSGNIITQWVSLDGSDISMSIPPTS